MGSFLCLLLFGDMCGAGARKNVDNYWMNCVGKASLVLITSGSLSK